MNRRAWTRITISFLLGSVLVYGYWRWTASKVTSHGDLLALMPADANAIIFADLAELRQAPFFAQLFAWAPKPLADAEYAQFLRDTGFDYERDLSRIAIAMENRGQPSTFIAVADGRFNREQIAAYVAKAGAIEKRQGRDIYSLRSSGSTRKLYFAFLRNNRIALSNDTGAADFWNAQKTDAEWRARFERLSGSPIFAVIRQDAATSAALSSQAPRGFSSPQFSSLLAQLQWISVAGKPDGNALRVVAEGECATEATARQLTDALKGIVMLAQAGLNGAHTRQQLNPALHAAYAELLKSVDVSKLDRGDTKSVRVVFDLTPQFLQAPR
jgi:hypothetical protein